MKKILFRTGLAVLASGLMVGTAYAQGMVLTNGLSLIYDTSASVDEVGPLAQYLWTVRVQNNTLDYINFTFGTFTHVNGAGDPSDAPISYTPAFPSSTGSILVDPNTALWVGSYEIVLPDDGPDIGPRPDYTVTLTYNGLQWEDWGTTGSAGNGNLISVPQLQNILGINDIPEPSTMALVGSGLAGLLFIARRRQRK